MTGDYRQIQKTCVGCDSVHRNTRCSLGALSSHGTSKFFRDQQSPHPWFLGVVRAFEAEQNEGDGRMMMERLTSHMVLLVQMNCQNRSQFLPDIGDASQRIDD